MSLKISLKKNINQNKTNNFVLFCDENFKIFSLDKLHLAQNSATINKMIINYKSKENNFLSFNLNPSQKLILIKLKSIKSSLDNEKTGADFYDYIKKILFLFLHSLKEILAK